MLLVIFYLYLMLYVYVKTLDIKGEKFWIET